MKQDLENWKEKYDVDTNELNEQIVEVTNKKDIAKEHLNDLNNKIENAK